MRTLAVFALLSLASVAGCVTSDERATAWDTLEQGLLALGPAVVARREADAPQGRLEIELGDAGHVAYFFMEQRQEGSFTFGARFPETSGTDAVLFMQAFDGSEPPVAWPLDSQISDPSVHAELAGLQINDQELRGGVEPGTIKTAYVNGTAAKGFGVVGVGVAPHHQGSASLEWTGDARVLVAVVDAQPLLLDIESLEGTALVGNFGPAQVDVAWRGASQGNAWYWTSMFVMLSGRMSLCVTANDAQCVEQTDWTDPIQRCSSPFSGAPDEVALEIESDDGALFFILAVPYAPGSTPFAGPPACAPA